MSILQLIKAPKREGASLSEDTFQANFNPHDSCVMCNANSAQRCSQCRSSWYCSQECQESDWPSHKLLCKRFATQTSRPSPNHKRAIFFPVDREQPRMIWVPIDYKMYEGVPYHDINPYPYLGEDCPVTGIMRIEHNPVRGRNLGSGMVAFAAQKEGYSVAVIHREAFLKDGSLTNKSILKSVRLSGIPPHSWRGPIIALRTTPSESFEDITLADFRHIIDYLVSYRTTETRESTTKPDGRLTATVRGVKICCLGEEKLHGSEPYISVDVSRAHPARLTFGHCDISPISRLVGMPLKIWKYSDIDQQTDPPGWVGNESLDRNPNAVFLMMETDPKKPDWGWIPRRWSEGLGNILAVRADDKDLTVKDVRMMCYFARHKLQPMFEDAMGSGSVQRTKQEVLEFITWGNMVACEDDI